MQLPCEFTFNLPPAGLFWLLLSLTVSIIAAFGMSPLIETFAAAFGATISTERSDRRGPDDATHSISLESDTPPIIVDPLGTAFCSC